MPASHNPVEEAHRLKALHDLRVLDTEPEEPFESLTHAAALACGAPMACVCLVDSDRLWYKAQVGWTGALQGSSIETLSRNALSGGAFFEVPDASQDPRFAQYPEVTDEPQLRFYAGVSLRLSDGNAVGVLCVMGPQVGHLNAGQRATLGHLAAAVVSVLERRRERLKAQQFQAVAVAEQARMQAMYDAAPAMVHTVDAQRRLIRVSDIWLNTLGYTREEVLGRSPIDFLAESSHERFRAAMQTLFTTGRCEEIPYHMVTKSGAMIAVRLSAALERDRNGAPLRGVAIIQNISAENTARRAATDLLDTLRSQFIVSVADRVGSIVEVNDAFCAISRFDRAELLGANHRIVNSGHHSTEFFTNMWRTIASGKPWRGEICNRARDGTLYWVDSVIAPLFGAHGEVDRYVSVRTDITDRKKLTIALEKSEQLLLRTGEFSGVGGWEFDVATQAVAWSPQTFRIHGLTLDYVPKLDEAINFYAPEARPVISTAVANAMATGEGWDLELPFIQADSTRIWVRAIGNADLADGKPVRLSGTFQDITSLREQRMALAELNERMSLATRSGGIGVWEYEYATGLARWDKTVFELYGVTQTEADWVTFAKWIQLVHPQDRSRVIADSQPTGLAVDAIVDHEFRIIRPNGQVHHLRSTGRVRAGVDGKAERIVGISWDVTELRGLAIRLQQQHELLHVTLMSIGDAVITTDPDGTIDWLNPVAERLTGWLSAEARGRQLEQVFNIVDEETRRPAENPVAVCLQQGQVAGMAHHSVLLSRHGEEFGIEDSAAPIRNDQGEVLGAVLVFHDVTEARRLSGEMSYRASHDSLTGLVNRVEFDARLRRLLQKSQEDQSQHALMYIDLDQFKLVNDACGHTAGDVLLQQVSRLLTDAVRTRDTLARLGGDEFGILLDHCSSDQAQRVAQQICDRMEEFRFLHDGRRFRIGTSIGLVPVDNRWSSTAAVMQAADTSCYAAKEAGRNRVHAWFDTDQAMQTRHGEMQWTARIEQALDDNRFVLFAQRIEALTDGPHKLHAEVLLRMVDLDGSLIPPGAFLPAAERFQLATRIDRWVLQNAIAELVALPSLDHLDCLSINLSGQSVGDRAFHRYAVETLQAAGQTVCEHVCIEVTETSAITNLADASLFIQQVRTLGIRIALDDFGAGASSFGYLKTLKVDYLKIDGQFIKDLIEDPLDDAAVRCFIDVAKVMGMQTVAEFVDRHDVLARLKELSVDFGQGYLLHRPEPLENLFPVSARH